MGGGRGANKTDGGEPLSDPQLGSNNTAYQTHQGLRDNHHTAGPLITILSSGFQTVGLRDALLIVANESHKCGVKGAGDDVF